MPVSSVSVGRAAAYGAYADAADVDLVALAGMETDALQSIAAAYGVPEEHRYTDWRDLVDHGQLDLVSIAAPTTLHAPIAVTALDAGMHVLSRSRWPRTSRPLD